MIDMLGGYDSWLFAYVSLGCAVIGIALMMWKKYLCPIYYFGILLIFMYLTNLVSNRHFTDPGTIAVTSIVPSLCTLGFLLLSLKIMFRPHYVPNKDNDKEEK